MLAPFSVAVKFSESEALVLLQGPVNTPVRSKEQEVVALEVLHPLGIAGEV